MEQSVQLHRQPNSSIFGSQESSLSKSLTLPARKIESSLPRAKLMKLLVLSLKPGEEQFYLTQAVKNHLESLIGECYVISVSGSPMVGKSSILDLLLTFFICSDTEISRGDIPYQEIYPTGNGKKPMTDGVDMYCISVHGKNFIFLDIEGDNDPTKKKTGVWIDTNLLQTAVGVSHIHIYNFLNFPQNSFLHSFGSISQMIKQNHVHPEFGIKFAFLKRDDPISERAMLPEEMEEYRAEYEEVISKDLDYSLHLLPMPPQHLTQKQSKASCISLTGVLCRCCQKHLFISMLLDLKNDLLSHLDGVKPFKSGHDVSKALEQIVEINKRELPFSSDDGYIGKIRMDKFKKEQVRIRDGLLGFERLKASDDSLFEQFQHIISDHPKLGDKEFCKNFRETQTFLAEKIARMEYIVPELSKFIEQYLLEEKASILNDEEKKALWDAYVAHFEELNKKIIPSLKEYHEMIESFWENLSNIKEETKTNLKKYKSARSETFNKVMAIVVDLASSGALRFIAKEMTEKTIAAVFVGGGVVGTVFTVYFFIDACQQLHKALKKSEDSLNPNKVDGIDGKGTKEKMTIIEAFVTQLVGEIEMSRKTLKEVCSDEAKGNLQLIEDIREAMEEKVKGMGLSGHMKIQLTQGMKAAEDNLQRFKKCL